MKIVRARQFAAEERLDRHPQNVGDLFFARNCFRVLRSCKNEHAHDQACFVGRNLGERRDELVRAKIDRDLFERFSNRRVERRAVAFGDATAGKCHLSGPRIRLAFRAFDEEHLGA